MQEPEASSEGLGGTYFFMNEAGRRAGIVKPCDEEPLAPNNPKVPPGLLFISLISYPLAMGALTVLYACLRPWVKAIKSREASLDC